MTEQSQRLNAFFHRADAWFRPRDLRHALIIYTLLVLVFSSPYWAFGQVLAPYEYPMVGLSATDPDENSVARFSDYYNGFIPETDDLLNGNRSGWLKLWSDETEYGRPTYHTSGFGPAYPLGLVLGIITHDPVVYLTLLAWLTLTLGGLFAMLLTREWGGSPAAGLLSGALVLTLPYLTFWMSFAVFIQTVVWTLGVIYGVVLLARRPTLVAWGFLVFAASALLLTGYPQTIVYSIYAVTGYTLLLVIGQWRLDRTATYRFVGVTLLALCVAIGLAAPLYLDILTNAADSVRVNAGYTFFSGGSAYIKNFNMFATILLRFHNPDFLGNPLAEGYPKNFSAEAFPPVVSALMMIGMFRARGVERYWIGLFAVLLFVASFPPLHEFMVMHMGFNLSRGSSLGYLKIPGLLLAFTGVRAIVDSPSAPETKRTVLAMLVVQVVIIVIELYIVQRTHKPLSTAALAIAVVLLACVAIQPVRASGWVLAFAVLVSGVWYSYPLMLREPWRASVLELQPYKKLRDMIPPGTRTAIIPGNIPFLGNNVNAWFDVPSIHTYNSLAPARYSKMINSLGGQVLMYGRRNASINPDYQSLPYWMSNIGLLYSNMGKFKNTIHLIDRVRFGRFIDGLFVYESPTYMGPAIVVSQTLTTQHGRDVDMADPRPNSYTVPRLVRDADDLLLFSVVPTQPSLLVISQKYHPQWYVEVEQAGEWREAPSLVVNGFFQGVALDPGVTQVRLEFRPYIRWLWVCYLWWAGFLIAVVWQRWRRKPQPDALTEHAPAHQPEQS